VPILFRHGHTKEDVVIYRTNKSSFLRSLHGGDLRSSLHPDHYHDLKKSGLSDAIIEAAGVHSVPPRLIEKIMGSRGGRVRSMLAFPYPGTDFVRFKLFPPLADKEGHEQKYYQAAGSEVRAYFPPGFDPNHFQIYLTEGEKKALRAIMDGRNCIGLGGIWNFAKKDANGNPVLIPDLAAIDWHEKEVVLAPDGDWQIKAQVAHAVYRLAKMVEAQGAQAPVKILKLPYDVKFDDYLEQRMKDIGHATK
jgi:Domain of unknown function (DUF3854)